MGWIELSCVVYQIREELGSPPLKRRIKCNLLTPSAMLAFPS